MNSFFIVLLLLSLLGLVIGLIKPATVKMQSRSKAALVFGVAIIVCFGLISATSKPSAATTAVTPAATPDTTTASAPAVAQSTPSTPVSAPTPKKSVPAPVAPVITPVAPAPTPTPTPAPQPTTLLSISGTGTKSTQTFTTPSNSWQLSYTYDCSDYGGKGNFQVYIMTADGSMSFDNSPVNELGASGSDTEYYHSGGSYYLEVNSECAWTVNVKG